MIGLIGERIKGNYKGYVWRFYWYRKMLVTRKLEDSGKYHKLVKIAVLNHSSLKQWKFFKPP